MRAAPPDYYECGAVIYGPGKVLNFVACALLQFWTLDAPVEKWERDYSSQKVGHRFPYFWL